MKALKIILPVALVLIALIATYFLAPLKEWKEWKNREKEKDDNIYYIQAPKGHTIIYQEFCISYWKNKFITPTIDGGMLPEITVTPK